MLYLVVFIFNVVYRHVVRMGCCIYKSFPFYQSSIGSNTRSPFCEIVSYETIRKPPLLDPLLWVGDPVSEMVKMGLLYA